MTSLWELGQCCSQRLWASFSFSRPAACSPCSCTECRTGRFSFVLLTDTQQWDADATNGSTWYLAERWKACAAKRVAVVLDKLMVAWLIPGLYGTYMFITAFTTASRWSWSWVTSVWSLRCISVLFSHLCQISDRNSYLRLPYLHANWLSHHANNVALVGVACPPSSRTDCPTKLSNFFVYKQSASFSGDCHVTNRWPSCQATECTASLVHCHTGDRGPTAACCSSNGSVRRIWNWKATLTWIVYKYPVRTAQ